MLIASLIIGPLFTAGFAVMLKELVKAPVGYQDKQGFHESASHERTASRAKRKKARRQVVSHPSFEGFHAAHAR